MHRRIHHVVIASAIALLTTVLPRIVVAQSASPPMDAGEKPRWEPTSPGLKLGGALLTGVGGFTLGLGIVDLVGGSIVGSKRCDSLDCTDVGDRVLTRGWLNTAIGAGMMGIGVPMLIHGASSSERLAPPKTIPRRSTALVVGGSIFVGIGAATATVALSTMTVGVAGGTCLSMSGCSAVKEEDRATLTGGSAAFMGGGVALVAAGIPMILYGRVREPKLESVTPTAPLRATVDVGPVTRMRVEF